MIKLNKKPIFYLLILAILVVPSVSFGAVSKTPAKAVAKSDVVAKPNYYDQMITALLNRLASQDKKISELEQRIANLEAQLRPTVTSIPSMSQSTNTTQQEHNQKVSAFKQEIFDIKTRYYEDIAKVDGTAGFLNQANGQKLNMYNEATSKINHINTQIRLLGGEPEQAIPSPNTSGCYRLCGVSA